jgi:hypothetical protein
MKINTTSPNAIATRAITAYMAAEVPLCNADTLMMMSIVSLGLFPQNTGMAPEVALRSKPSRKSLT